MLGRVRKAEGPLNWALSLVPWGEEEFFSAPFSSLPSKFLLVNIQFRGSSLVLSTSEVSRDISYHTSLPSLRVGCISSCFPIKHLAKFSLSPLTCLMEGKDPCLPLLCFPTTPNTLLSTNGYSIPFTAISKFKTNPCFFSPLVLALWLFGLVSFWKTFLLSESNENLPFHCHFNMLLTLYYYFILFGHQWEPTIISIWKWHGIFLWLFFIFLPFGTLAS